MEYIRIVNRSQVQLRALPVLLVLAVSIHHSLDKLFFHISLMNLIASVSEIDTLSFYARPDSIPKDTKGPQLLLARQGGVLSSVSYPRPKGQRQAREREKDRVVRGVKSSQVN